MGSLKFRKQATNVFSTNIILVTNIINLFFTTNFMNSQGAVCYHVLDKIDSNRLASLGESCLPAFGPVYQTLGDISQPKTGNQHQSSANHTKPAKGWRTAFPN